MGLDVFFSFFSRSCLTFRCLVLPGDYPSDRTGWLRRSSCRATRCVHFPFLFLVAFGPRVALRRPAANDKCRDCPPSANCLLHHDGLLLFLLPLRILFSFFFVTPLFVSSASLWRSHSSASNLLRSSPGAVSFPEEILSQLAVITWSDDDLMVGFMASFYLC